MGGQGWGRPLERVVEAPPRFCHPPCCTPRPTVTRAAPQSRSSGSSRCARFTRSWTPMRIFTVSGTSSTCGAGAVSTAQGRPGGRRAHRGAYLVHASDDLLELGRAVHEGTAPALGETGSCSRGRQADTPSCPYCAGEETEAQRPQKVPSTSGRGKAGSQAPALPTLPAQGCQGQAAVTFLYTRSIGQPTLMSTKSTSMVRFSSSAHLVMVSGKAPSSCGRWRSGWQVRGQF